MNKFYQLNLKEITAYILAQRPSFWMILLYLVFEYMRPQSMYPAIDVFPWTQTILIIAAILTALEGKILRVKNNGNTFINIFFVVILISSVLALSPKTSFIGIKTFFILFLVYYLITNIVDTEQKLFIFVLLFILLNLKLSQFVFRQWLERGFEYEKYGAVAGMGWLKNPGELAIQICIVFSISTFFLLSLWNNLTKIKRFFFALMPIIFIGSILACGSRGSFLAIGVIIIAMWIASKRKLVGIILIAIFALSLPYIMSERDIERTLNMGTSEDSTAQNRLERWKKGIYMTNKYPFFGVGYENWAVADTEMFHGTGAEPHNIFIECMSELGYGGLIVFLLLIISTLKNNSNTIKLTSESNDRFIPNFAKSLNLALLGYLAAGFFVTVLYYPYFWVNLAMTISTNNIANKKYVAEGHEEKDRLPRK
jgi:putative inorganic carbon (hco3(-)) transporter